MHKTTTARKHLALRLESPLEQFNAEELERLLAQELGLSTQEIDIVRMNTERSRITLGLPEQAADALTRLLHAAPERLAPYDSLTLDANGEAPAADDDTTVLQENDLSRPKSLPQYARLFFTGFAMGASDIVPGVSGGTMAFILGVYETLINAIKSFNLNAIKMALGLLRPTDENPRSAASVMRLVDYVHLRFLLPLGFGLLAAIFLLSSLLEGWLQTQPTYVFAFFGGLIVASVLAIGLKVKWSVGPALALAVGAAVAYFITNPELGTLGDQLGHGTLALLISGMIAICAMILPGISGSFILLILGQYDFVLGAVKDRDLLSLAAVAVGAVIGLLAFSRILSWLLKHYEQTTVALLIGFMVGSLRLIVFRATHHIDEITSETTPLVLEGQQLAIAGLLALVGFVLVSVLDHLQSGGNPFIRLLPVGRRQN